MQPWARALPRKKTFGERHARRRQELQARVAEAQRADAALQRLREHVGAFVEQRCERVPGHRCMVPEFVAALAEYAPAREALAIMRADGAPYGEAFFMKCVLSAAQEALAARGIELRGLAFGTQDRVQYVPDLRPP